MKKFKVTIKGIVPLLQHRFPSEKEEEKAKKVSGSRDYSEEVELSLYKDEKGQIYQPADHILNAMIRAAGDFRITGRGKKTYKDLIKTSISITPDAIPHKNQKWVVDRRPVVVNKARIIRERPRFDDWELTFSVEVFDDQISAHVIKEILDQAGKIGIGDFRPRFGRFIVTEFKEI